MNQHRWMVPETLSLGEDDPSRNAVECGLRQLDLGDLKALWLRNHAAASAARRAGEIARVITLVRGAKTIQRIAAARGAVFSVEREFRRTGSAS
jgi:hypothetical protein